MPPRTSSSPSLTRRERDFRFEVIPARDAVADALRSQGTGPW